MSYNSFSWVSLGKTCLHLVYFIWLAKGVETIRCCAKLVFILFTISLQQGSLNCFATGPHKVLHKSSRAGLTKCDCFDIVHVTYTRPNQQILRKYIVFPLMTKWLRGTDEMASIAAFGLRM